ncbi:hypothetical protein BGZ67_006607, partial [Mortierella alpina]
VVKAAEKEDEMELAKKVRANICKDSDHTQEWFDCIMCCQGLSPNKKQEGEDHEKVKSGISKNTGELRDKICGAKENYAAELKDILDGKDDTKGSDGTEDGMKDFFEKKMKCFLGCEEDSECRP